ncbi:MAG: Recombination endonuclease [Frankiales bacterium]|nr:Recombination endonuclease [Frankiales bacterium]
MKKTCRDCGEQKSVEEFSPSTKNRDGRVSYCRDCFRVRSRTYRDKAAGGPQARRSAVRASSPAVKWCPSCQRERPRDEFGKNRSSGDGLTSYCSPCHNAITRGNVLRNHGSTRDFHLRRRYGLDSADVARMVADQGRTCALCRARSPQHVDHDHLTGLVRGILCSTCNQGLGNFADDAARLRLAADYVEGHSWQKVREAVGVVRLVAPRPGPEARPAVDLGPLLAAARRRAAAPRRRPRLSAVARRHR